MFHNKRSRGKLEVFMLSFCLKINSYIFCAYEKKIRELECPKQRKKIYGYSGG